MYKLLAARKVKSPWKAMVMLTRATPFIAARGAPIVALILPLCESLQKPSIAPGQRFYEWPVLDELGCWICRYSFSKRRERIQLAAH